MKSDIVGNEEVIVEATKHFVELFRQYLIENEVQAIDALSIAVNVSSKCKAMSIGGLYQQGLSQKAIKDLIPQLYPAEMQRMAVDLNNMPNLGWLQMEVGFHHKTGDIVKNTLDKI